MNHPEFSGIESSFLHRRYAIRLGRRYVSAAASVILLGLVGSSRVNNLTAAAQSLPTERQEFPLERRMVTAAIAPQVEAKLVAAGTKLGFRLFAQLLQPDTEKNVSLSPASVALALAMIYNGAGGETQQAMAKTLELQGIGLPEINSANTALLAALTNSDPSVQLTISNSLCARQEYPLKPDFLQRTQNFYKAQIANLDFSNPGAITAINDWVKQNTNGKIDQIVNQINSDDVLFLVNAIYFNGKWTQAFDQQQTTEESFYLASGEQKQHPMMSQAGEYGYYQTEQFQAVSLPYGDNGRLSMYIFLPKQSSSLSAFLTDLNAENWEQWMTQFSNRKGLVRLPRFQVESDLTLNDALKTLGMAVAFEPGANFSGMGEKLSLSEVKHKTFVEVNEAGTAAAAATSSRVALISAIISEEPFQMIVNRPFFSAIRNNQTGTVMFMSAIAEPV